MGQTTTHVASENLQQICGNQVPHWVKYRTICNYSSVLFYQHLTHWVLGGVAVIIYYREDKYLEYFLWTLPSFKSLHWRHNGHDSVSNHQPNDCLLNRLFRCRSKKTSKLRVTGLCVGGIHRRPVNSPYKWPVTRKMFPFDDVIMI